jgi:peptidyl-prolyl cis-trans isomerase D
VVGALASAKFLDAIFNPETLKAKRNTDAVEVGANQLVSARVLQHQPVRLLPLAEVKDRVVVSLVEEQSAALAKKEGVARLAALQVGAAADGLPPVVVSRNATQGFSPAMMDAVLRADTSKLPVAVGVDQGAQGYVVLRITQVLPREPAPGGEEGVRSQYAQAWAGAEADAYLVALKKRFKVEIKPAAEWAAASSAGETPAPSTQR